MMGIFWLIHGKRRGDRRGYSLAEGLCLLAGLVLLAPWLHRPIVWLLKAACWAVLWAGGVEPCGFGAWRSDP